MEIKALETKGMCAKMFTAMLFMEAKHWERLMSPHHGGACNHYTKHTASLLLMPIYGHRAHICDCGTLLKGKSLIIDYFFKWENRTSYIYIYIIYVIYMRYIYIYTHTYILYT